MAESSEGPSGVMGRIAELEDMLAEAIADKNREAAESKRLRDLVDYWTQDASNTDGPRIVDVAYTAFMGGKQPNDEDGGPSDWMTDTKPSIVTGIAVMREKALGGRKD